MTTPEAYLKALEEQWGDVGECGSCGWHAAFYEHRIDEDDIDYALSQWDGVLRLVCLSKDDDESYNHRGVRVHLKSLLPSGTSST